MTKNIHITNNIIHSKEQDFFALLPELSAIFSKQISLQDIILHIFKFLDTHYNLTCGFFYLNDSQTNTLYKEIEYNLNEKFSEQRLEVCQSVIETGTSLYIEDLAKNIDLSKKLTGNIPNEPVSLICVPLIHNKTKMGVIYAKFNNPNNTQYKILNLFSLIIGQETKLQQIVEFEKEALRKENLRLKDELKDKYNIHNMVGNSQAMHDVYENISQVANSNASVLIRGESGTGKELVAHAIHYNSPRAQKPFIKINCGAIPENLIESELFGYEKGAFTDATELKMGKFEAANGGSIFLDEIAELPLHLQVKLLRVLQEKEITRVGGINTIKINVRIIAATNKDLEVELKENRLREDLFYRLNVFPIFLPSLRERKSDILLLAEHFINRFAKENDKNIKRISTLAIDLLTSYHWPGNARELENCMERAVVLCKGDSIQALHLPPRLQRVDTTPSAKNTNDETLSLEEMVNNFERDTIIDALKRTRYNKSKAARYLKTTSRIIGYKISQLNIPMQK